MSRNKTSRQESARASQGKPRPRITIALALARALSLAAGGAVLARLRGAGKQLENKTSQVTPASLTPSSPSKEYICAGGKLVATEEPTASGPAHRASTIGVRAPSSPSATFYLSNITPPGNADITLNFGGPSWLPIAGDWDGNGSTTIGAYQPGTARFFLRNANAGGTPDITVFFGLPNWKPVVGDWYGL